MKRIEFVFFDAGGGHRCAATALKAVIEEQGRPWRADLVNLQEQLDTIDIFRKVTGIRLQDIYNRMLARGWTLGSEHLLRFMQRVLRAYHPAQVRILSEGWKRQKPAMVVSVVPNFNGALYQALQTADPAIPFVTILTDFVDYPPNFWMEPQDQYFICGTEKAVIQARSYAKNPDKVLPVSGMILRPSFYQEFDHNRSSELQALGLDPDRPTGLVLFGGHGSPIVLRITRELQRATRELQLIVICGKNQKLENELRRIAGAMRLHVVGFTPNVPYYMSLADFFIGKAGPGSISEAIHMKLPVIIERNAWTLPQERYNADWVLEKRVGLVIDSFHEVGRAVDILLEPARLAEYKANAASICNRAVFEIPDILGHILERE